MKEKITPHLKDLLHIPGIAGQYVVSENIEIDNTVYTDPLMEDRHEVVKGLVHKYGNRALIKVSYQCAAHCRFCTRIRQIGDPRGTLTEEDMSNIAAYLGEHPEIDDVILSGGDPLYTPKITKSLLLLLKDISSIRVFRIGSRLALHSPQSVLSPLVKDLLDLVDEIGKEKPFFLLLHVNHPAELTTEVRDVIRYFRSLHITILSQTVFLKNINDEYDVLFRLYETIYHLGVLPYYLYHCDSVAGLEHFVVDMTKEQEIVTKLYQSLSGIACPRYIIDIANGYGKIPVPLDFLNLSERTITDFRDQKLSF